MLLGSSELSRELLDREELRIAPPATRQLRELARFHAKLVALRSGLNSQVHAVLAKAGVLIAVSDLFGVEGLARVPVGTAYAQRVTSLMELIDVLDAHERRFADPIAAKLRGDRGYWAIQELPGVGPTLGAVFVAEIGTCTASPIPVALCPWAGLTPNTASPTRLSIGGTSPSRAPNSCVGGRGSHPTPAGPARRSRSTANASRPAAARTSPRSPGPQATTGCAMGTSEPWPTSGRRREIFDATRARPGDCLAPENTAGPRI